MLAELSETDATGEIAGIFAEVRQLWGVPYVSAIQRHLATRPGFLEWAWEAVGPAFRDGRAQEAGWTAAAGLTIAPLVRIPRPALAVWGVDARGIEMARLVADGFVRVAPVNMMFAALVKRLLAGEQPVGSHAAATLWAAPAALPAPPAMVDPASLDADQRSVLMLFASEMDGKPFVPGLYRMLAHWPGLLAHLGTVLAPRLTSEETRATCDLLRARIDAAVPAVLAGLPSQRLTRPTPPPAERTHFNAVGETYRKTSPELVVVGRLIRDALPGSVPDKSSAKP